MQPIESYVHHNKYINIYQDDDPECPRQWDTLGTLLCWHRRYNLGDQMPESLACEFNSKSPDNFERWSSRNADQLLILPVYLYDHSGLAMKTTPFQCRWDSGQVGYIYTSYASIRRNFQRQRVTRALLEQAKTVLEQEVAAYNQYLQGDVYGYQVLESITSKDATKLDSCWGFYGYENCKEAAEQSVQNWRENDRP